MRKGAIPCLLGGLQLPMRKKKAVEKTTKIDGTVFLSNERRPEAPGKNGGIDRCRSKNTITF
jgi:hypothetical protein